MIKIEPCPLCGEYVYISVHDRCGNYMGELGCDYEKTPYSGLSYALHHDGYDNCLLCTEGRERPMGQMLFTSEEEAAKEWDKLCKINQFQIKPGHAHWIVDQFGYGTCSHCHNIEDALWEKCPVCGCIMEDIKAARRMGYSGGNQNE